MITAQMVKELREKTGAGMMDCKKVLTEANGDMEKAAELLREKGIAKAAKKSDRIAAEGLVLAYLSEDSKIGAAVEVNSETDFVAQNAEFKSFVEMLAKQVALKNPADVEELLEQTSIEDESKKISEILIDKTAKIGEKLSIRRFARFEASNGIVEKYIHGDGKIAVLVEMENADNTLAKDICMQIAAAKPEYLNREAVPAERVDKEIEILKVQAMNEGKPENIAEKVVKGRIDKFYGEICLLEQPFVKDPDMKVCDLLKSKNANLIRFARIEKGEGIEKKEENFAEEVMKQIK